MSDRVPEKESLQLSGTKGSPLTPSQTLNSVPEGKPALPSPAIMQKVPVDVLFLLSIIFYKKGISISSFLLGIIHCLQLHFT